MDALLHGFSDTIKVAISAGMTLGLIKGRVAQGARVAPALMQRAEQAAASGMTRTAPTMRHLALGAGESARAAGKATAMAPMKAGLQGRMAQGEKMIQSGTAFDQSRPLKIHDAFGHSHGYSPEYMKTVSGSSATVADPRKLMTPAAAPAPAAGGTVPAKKRALTPGPVAGATVPAVSRPPSLTSMNRRSVGTANTQLAMHP